MTRAYHHGALADALVDRALADVRERGEEHLSLRAVAQAVGVSPSAAYNHFADKEALLHAVGSRGLVVMDDRMARALAAHPDTDDRSAIDRFHSLGRAYLGFAIDEPHLFRLVFGPAGVHLSQQAESSAPYRRLTEALDDLDDLRLLKPGVRPGLEVTIWAATHGLAALMVDGALPPEAGEALVDSIARLILERS